MILDTECPRRRVAPPAAPPAAGHGRTSLPAEAPCLPGAGGGRHLWHRGRAR